MRSDKKGFGHSISTITPINSHALTEADGTNRRPDPNKGAGCNITGGAYGHRGPITKDPRVSSREPPRKPAAARVKQP
jgi:hypothetical protein